jgi:hypothetical protein
MTARAISAAAILRNGGKGLLRIPSAPGQQTGKATHGKGVGISGIIRKDLVQDGERGIEIIHDHMRKCQPHKGRREPRPERQDCLENGPCLPDEPLLAGQIGQIQQAGHLFFGNHISLPF